MCSADVRRLATDVARNEDKREVGRAQRERFFEIALVKLKSCSFSRGIPDGWIEPGPVFAR